MKNLNGMNLKMMQPRCPESKRMVDWVEKGIYDALANSYISTLYFGVSSDPAGSNLIEEYIFSFTYGPTGALIVSCSMSCHIVMLHSAKKIYDI